MFQVIGRSLLEGGGDEASAFLQDLASGKYPHERLLRELLPKFATMDPAEALSLALGQAHKETVDRVAGRWARDDWDAAYASVMNLEEASDRNRALEGLLSLSGGVPKDLPYEQMESLLVLAEENDLSINFAYALRNMPIEQSEALLATYPELLDASLEYVFFPRTSDDLKLLAERLPDSIGKRRGLERAVREWSEKDPKATADWVRDLEFEGDPSSLYGPLISSWSGYDSKAARDWVGSLKDEKQRTAAAEAYVGTNAVLHGAAAWQVARDAGNLSLQVMALRGWAGTDPISAGKALGELEAVDPKLEEAFKEAAAEHETWNRFLNPQ